jgi:hypothetical protein
VQTTVSSSLITDNAGHTLRILFSKAKSKNRRIALSITSFTYDNVATSTSALIKYKWNTDKQNKYNMLASYFATSASLLESHWRPKKNQTIIMTKPLDFDDSDVDDDADARPTKEAMAGMVVPYLVTGRGSVIIKY